jgi:hypothetical protein
MPQTTPIMSGRICLAIASFRREFEPLQRHVTAGCGQGEESWMQEDDKFGNVSLSDGVTIYAHTHEEQGCPPHVPEECLPDLTYKGEAWLNRRVICAVRHLRLEEERSSGGFVGVTPVVRETP